MTHLNTWYAVTVLKLILSVWVQINLLSRNAFDTVRGNKVLAGARSYSVSLRLIRVPR